METGHADRDHATLSPSSAKRWRHCPPSALLEAQFPNTTSEAAEEGTLCHELCEGKLLNKVNPNEYPNSKLIHLRSRCKLNPLWDDEMEETSDVYVNKIYEDALGFKVFPLILAEQRFDLTEWIPNGFGTGDCVMIGDEQMNVYDYKHGKGVAVDADHNDQMILYSLGALKTFGWMANIKRVKMCIIQPRLNSITEFECSVEELIQFGEEIKPDAQKAYKGEGEFCSGDWCRFCRARQQCRARAEVAFGLKDKVELIPPLITPEEASKYLEAGEEVSKWLKDLQDWALSSLLDGQEVPGWKAVEGRSNRTLTDVDEAYAVLIKNDVPKAMLYETVPVSLTAAEKVAGKKVFAELLKDYIVKPPGKPTLVKASDKRDAITNRTSAEEAFGSKGE